jgi:uncharacterized membrane protein YjjP (DUF1212 family)
MSNVNRAVAEVGAATVLNHEIVAEAQPATKSGRPGEKACFDQLAFEQRAELMLSFARVLFVNGQSTDRTVAAAERVGNVLGLQGRVIPRWGLLQLQAENHDTRRTFEAIATPSDVDIDRVAAAMQVVEQLHGARLAPEAATKKLNAISVQPPSATWLFALAAGAAALALSVIYGIQHWPAAALIFASATIGGVVRRVLTRYSTNLFLQPFCAALLAGVIGALAVRFHLSSSLRLVAVCPCMILVPGPHVLNGALDLINIRVQLGMARLVYAGLTVLAISSGLLIGLGLLGVSLPVDGVGRSVPAWADVVASAVAILAYGVFFSAPMRMLPLPIIVGMLAHGARWVFLTILGYSVANGAFIACLVVAIVLLPALRRWSMPFAAIGFVSVVSMIPGVYLFRMGSGLVELTNGSPPTLQLLAGTLADGITAVSIIIAMSLGLIIPNLLIDHFGNRVAPL